MSNMKVGEFEVTRNLGILKVYYDKKAIAIKKKIEWKDLFIEG